MPQLLAQRRDLIELRQRLARLMRIEHRARRQERRNRQIVAIIPRFQMLRRGLERFQRRRWVGLLQRNLRLCDEMLCDPCRRVRPLRCDAAQQPRRFLAVPEVELRQRQPVRDVRHQEGHLHRLDDRSRLGVRRRAFFEPSHGSVRLRDAGEDRRLKRRIARAAYQAQATLVHLQRLLVLADVEVQHAAVVQRQPQVVRVAGALERRLCTLQRTERRPRLTAPAVRLRQRCARVADALQIAHLLEQPPRLLQLVHRRIEVTADRMRDTNVPQRVPCKLQVVVFRKLDQRPRLAERR